MLKYLKDGFEKEKDILKEKLDQCTAVKMTIEEQNSKFLVKMKNEFLALVAALPDKEIRANTEQPKSALVP